MRSFLLLFFDQRDLCENCSGVQRLTVQSDRNRVSSLNVEIYIGLRYVVTPVKIGYKTSKFSLIFEDRAGIVADISALIARYGWNIVSMEVVRKTDKANVCVEAENDVNTHSGEKYSR